MTITKRVIYSKGDFDLTFEPIEDSIKIKKTKKGYEIKYLTPDYDPQNPFENDEGLGNFFHWKDYGQDQLFRYCELLGYEVATRNKIREDTPLAVRIDKYEHSGIWYSVKGEGMQCRWDTSKSWAVWYPNACLMEDINRFKTKKAKRKRAIELARGACKVFNQWANGEVYIIVKENYNRKKEQIDYDCVGGFFGYEDSLKALDTEI
jgi:hypothetical protein